MIFWIVLFILIIAVSFVLAIRSMRDYQENPSSGEEYGLFLIRKIAALNKQVLDSINNDLLVSKQFITFERLIKGDKSALVVYGPENVLLDYKESLDLLELLDYTNVDLEYFSAWEVGLKNTKQLTREEIRNYFKKFPSLSTDEQFWWQLILFPKKDRHFQIQIRAVVISSDVSKRESLTFTLQNLEPNLLIKLPKAFSNAQLLDFYQKRSFNKSPNNLNISSNEVYALLSF